MLLVVNDLPVQVTVNKCIIYSYGVCHERKLNALVCISTLLTYFSIYWFVIVQGVGTTQTTKTVYLSKDVLLGHR